ncbi:MAG: hypothetical protein H6Q33_2072, partial [Deltaproteobacteria bacterium]|nr:hypothetical protein [Deltaproteobacteria bacterium]
MRGKANGGALPSVDRASVELDGQPIGGPVKEISAHTLRPLACQPWCRCAAEADAIQGEYRIKIPDAHWQCIETVGQLVDSIQKRQLLDAQSPVHERGTTVPYWQGQAPGSAPPLSGQYSNAQRRQAGGLRQQHAR